MPSHHTVCTKINKKSANFWGEWLFSENSRYSLLLRVCTKKCPANLLRESFLYSLTCRNLLVTFGKNQNKFGLNISHLGIKYLYSIKSFYEAAKAIIPINF